MLFKQTEISICIVYGELLMIDQCEYLYIY